MRNTITGLLMALTLVGCKGLGEAKDKKDSEPVTQPTPVVDPELPTYPDHITYVQPDIEGQTSDTCFDFAPLDSNVITDYFDTEYDEGEVDCPRSVTVPRGVHTIEDGSFEGSNLIALSLPLSVETVGTSLSSNVDLSYVCIESSEEDITFAESFLSTVYVFYDSNCVDTPEED